MKNPKLNQIIAVTQSKKARAHNLLTTAHRGWHKDRVNGIARTYKPLDEDGEQLPSENRNVQLLVKEGIGQVAKELIDFYNVVATQEFGNTKAKAPVVVDEQQIIPTVPVTCLLFLEKQLNDLRTFISEFPTLPTDREWQWDENRNCYATKSEVTVKTKKVPTTHVKFQPTEHHPGDAEIINVDKTVGHWTTTHLSGALPAQDKADMIARVEAVQDAVKLAREEANSVEVEPQKNFGKLILNYIFSMQETD